MKTDLERKPYDAGDPDSVRQAKAVGKMRQNQEDNDLRDVLSTPQGRRVIFRVLGICGIYRDVFCNNALSMANLAGMSKVGLILLAELQRVDPNAYLRMQTEALSQENDNA